MRALRKWVEAAQITSGRSFRHIKKGGQFEHLREKLNGCALFYILKRYIEQAELTGKNALALFPRDFYRSLLLQRGRWTRDSKRLPRAVYDTMSEGVRRREEFKSE